MPAVALRPLFHSSPSKNNVTRLHALDTPSNCDKATFGMIYYMLVQSSVRIVLVCLRLRWNSLQVEARAHDKPWNTVDFSTLR